MPDDFLAGRSALDRAAATVCRSLSEVLEVSAAEIDPLTARGVSIGIEIEVPWSSYFPQLWTKYRLSERKVYSLGADELVALTADCAALEADLLPRLQKTVEAGVPRGNDRYWEFAHRPVHDTRLLVEQVRLLSAAGLLPRDRKHSLQITVGDIPPCASLYYLAMLLEVEFVDPERVRVGIEETRKTIHTGWARKGRSGIHLKGPSDLQNGCQVASEIRMLQLPVDQAEFARLMSTVEWGANAILDVRNRRDTEAAGQWAEFESDAAAALVEHGLPASNWAQVGPTPGIRYDVWEQFANSMSSIRDCLARYRGPEPSQRMRS